MSLLAGKNAIVTGGSRGIGFAVLGGVFGEGVDLPGERLIGAFVGSFIIGFIYTFGTALLPDLAYVILFLPMVVVIAFKPQGLFGRVAT